MADSPDVMNALVAKIDAIRGLDSWRIYRGFPTAQSLDGELKNGAVHVTVNERGGVFRLTEGYLTDAVELPRSPVTLTVIVSGMTATFAGTCTVDQIAGIRAGVTAWATRCVANDTPAAVAARLATASGGTSSAASVTLAGLTDARTGRDSPTVRPTRQQEVGYSACVWCADPGTRDAVGGKIDAALSDVQFLYMPDSAARLIGMGGRTTDRSENASLYKRELYYLARYSTTIAGSGTPALWVGAVFNGNGALNGLGALPPFTTVQVDANGNPLVDLRGNLIGGYA
jgi:hypothetical protein